MGRPKLVEGPGKRITLMFSKESRKRAKAWGNRQRPKVSPTEAIRRLVDLALNCPGINSEIVRPRIANDV